MATHSSILAWRIPRNRGARWAAVHEEGTFPEQRTSPWLRGVGEQVLAAAFAPTAEDTLSWTSEVAEAPRGHCQKRQRAASSLLADASHAFYTWILRSRTGSYSHPHLHKINFPNPLSFWLHRPEISGGVKHNRHFLVRWVFPGHWMGHVEGPIFKLHSLCLPSWDTFRKHVFSVSDGLWWLPW